MIAHYTKKEEEEEEERRPEPETEPERQYSSFLNITGLINNFLKWLLVGHFAQRTVDWDGTTNVLFIKYIYTACQPYVFPFFLYVKAL